MQNSYPYTYEDSDELWLKQEEILENPLIGIFICIRVTILQS